MNINTKKTKIIEHFLCHSHNVVLIRKHHIFFKGMALAYNVNRKPMLTLVNKVINGIFHNPKDPFWTGRVMDLLFAGIEIDCTSEEFAVQAACTIFESGEVKAIEPLRENFFKFSFFGAVSI